MFYYHSPRRWMSAVALSAVVVTGCKSGVSIPIWNPFAKPVPSSGLVQSGENEYVQPSMPKTPSQTESSWTAPFKKLGDTLSAPFKDDADDVSTKNAPQDTISLAAKTGTPQPGLYVEIAKLHERSGKLSEAVGEYDKALDIDPKYQPALLGLARLYDRLGRYDEALVFYGRAAKNGADDAGVQNDYGLCLARSGNNQDAVAALRRAVSLDPQKVLYRNNLATVLVELGRTEEAYQTLVVVHGEAVAHYNVGFLLNKQGRNSEALVHFQQSVKLDSSLQEARQWVVALGGKPAATSAPSAVAEVPAAPPAPAAVAAPSPAPAAIATTVAPRPAEPAAAPTAPAAAVAADGIPAPPAKPAIADRPQPAAMAEPASRIEAAQPLPAAKIEDRYTVAAAQPSAGVQPASAVGAVPPLPEQISKLDVAAQPKSDAAAAPPAKTAEAKYPPSRY